VHSARGLECEKKSGKGLGRRRQGHSAIYTACYIGVINKQDKVMIMVDNGQRGDGT
jgi:hypothetical protein